jgi:hypothetical protein
VYVHREDDSITVEGPKNPSFKLYSMTYWAGCIRPLMKPTPGISYKQVDVVVRFWISMACNDSIFNNGSAILESCRSNFAVYLRVLDSDLFQKMGSSEYNNKRWVYFGHWPSNLVPAFGSHSFPAECRFLRKKQTNTLVWISSWIISQGAARLVKFYNWWVSMDCNILALCTLFFMCSSIHEESLQKCVRVLYKVATVS